MAVSRTPVAIVGASGYTGAELARLLLGHPRAELVAVCARTAVGSRLSDVFPQFAGRLELPIEAFDAARLAQRVELVFTALPHKAAAETVAALRRYRLRVIDLSADFRFDDVAVYEQWYAAHPAPELVAEAVYGLPERYREELRGAELIACPGCYPTSAILPVAPLLAAGLIRPEGLIIDAKSGASGAGRTPSRATMLTEAAGGVRAYKIAGTHRHIPEIEQELGRAASAPVTVTFTPHLLPMARGIFSCIYGTPTDPSRPPEAYQEALRQAYAHEPFVTLLEPGQIPDTAHVVGSNRAHVAVAVDQRAGRVIAMAAIDNLTRGSAGQAIQCMNLAMNWEETAGLDAVGLFP